MVTKLDFLSLYAEAVKEGGLEANVSLNGAEMAYGPA